MAGVRIKRDSHQFYLNPVHISSLMSWLTHLTEARAAFDNRNQNSLILQRTMFRDGMAAGSTPVSGEPR
jgi:hypothetical protein